MDTKTLDIRPDWTKQKYIDDHRIDLSTNVCFDAAIPTYEFDMNRYCDLSKSYRILSEYHEVYNRQICIGLGLSELIMRIMQLIHDKGWSMNSHHNSWQPIEMCRKLYKIPHGYDVLYLSNPHGTNGTKIDDYSQYLKDYKLVIIDEAYADFCEVPKVKLGQPDVLVLKTMSKSLALPGIRFGWAIGHEMLILELQNMRPAHVSIGGIDENLVSMLDEIPHHVKRMNQTKAYIEKTYQCIPSHGNYVLIKDYDKFTKQFHLKEFEDHARMALINRSMVTKNALNKEHPFFDRIKSD